MNESIAILERWWRNDAFLDGARPVRSIDRAGHIAPLERRRVHFDAILEASDLLRIVEIPLAVEARRFSVCPVKVAKV